ncbi:hypothetical protein PGTUg99_004638 [Puccinia graminis f. sp. tritici]|uniref:BED-type domain-containing protein n=1 Tax=Puccinia graminis f. sp. tritici TaxID=56615 RepID=A0A5B0LI76_PUCGR|nr:hypothetical protein PGTUg99_004638 [Puccinia graminis f. sp. tritici]
MAGKNQIKDTNDIEVVQPNNTESKPKRTAASNSDLAAVSATSHRIWVWSHFKLVSNNDTDTKSMECQVHVKTKTEDKLCGRALQRDPTGSKKSMSEHLRRLHKIYPSNQEKTNQLALPNLFKRQHVEHRPVLNGDLLKQAISYLVAKADLPYSTVERKSFQYLLELLNPATLNMDFGRKTIA